MVEENLFASLKKTLPLAQSVFISLPANPKFDQTAASLALFLSLKKSGKSVNLVCPTEMKVGFSDLVGIDKIKTKPQGRNLVISFAYLEDSIEKVSYNIEGNKFNLVVQPKAGFSPLSSDKVEYSYSGVDADLIFTLGVRDLNDLGGFYRQSKSLFEKEKIVDIDLAPKTNHFAQQEVILSASSFSEIVTRLVSILNLPADQDVGTNLLLGMKKATGSFSSPKVTALTFEAAAFCLRVGAHWAQAQKIGGKSVGAPLRPMPTRVSAAKKPQDKPEEAPFPTDESDNKWPDTADKKPSPDWLEPKVYKGSTRI